MLFTFDFDGLKACAMNCFEKSSDAFAGVIDNFDVCITYFYSPENKNFEVHFYSVKPEVHVGEICQKYGGGGHKGAAGCSMTFEQIQKFYK